MQHDAMDTWSELIGAVSGRWTIAVGVGDGGTVRLLFVASQEPWTAPRREFELSVDQARELGDAARLALIDQWPEGGCAVTLRPTEQIDRFALDLLLRNRRPGVASLQVSARLTESELGDLGDLLDRAADLAEA